MCMTRSRYFPCRSAPRLTATKLKPSTSSAACSACCREVSGMGQTTVTCSLCGRNFQKPASEVRPHNFCCADHARKWNARRLAAYNREENPLNQPGGAVSSRKKHREKLSGQGAGKAYRKFYGRHEHRAVAEAMLGRPLRTGEVVHHRDGDKLNNDPLNLEVLPSQAEHTKTQRRDRRGRWCL